MGFEPDCLPSPPSCPEDIVPWSETLVACLLTNFNAAFAQIQTLNVPPFELCAELEHLGPNCLVPGFGIDQTQFAYATAASQVIAGNGLLPVPPQPSVINYRAGAVIVDSSQTCDNPGGAWITLSPSLPAWNYAIFLTLGNNPREHVSIDASQPSNPNGFQIYVRPWSCDEGENQLRVWVYWMAIQYR